MAEMVQSSIVKIVFDRISAPILAEFGLLWGFNADLSGLESKISTIKDVLKEANEHGIDDEPVSNWLRKLKDVVDDAEDHLDIFRMRNNIHGVTNNAFAKINLRIRMAHKISQLDGRLEAIANERKNFITDRKCLKEHKLGIKTQETFSMVEKKAVFGRELEKKAIMHELLRTDRHEAISIISIVGLGGMGKTTLAQVVYNDETEVKNRFELKMWVFVSENFNIEAIMRSMIQSANGRRSKLDGLDSLGKELEGAIKEKRFLLVLDDVWSHTPEMWEKLKLVLEKGGKDSRIIVTTRMEKVAQQMRSTFIFYLEGLPQDICMLMFTERVFGKSISDINTQLAQIVKDIVSKCGGNPLAIKHLANIMQFKQGVDAWLAVVNSDIWIPRGDENDVMKTLQTSYMQLSPVLKDCFIYCSILPKGVRINKDELIGQWIAHGKIPVVDGVANMEDTGDEIFNDLLQMSFLQDPVTDENTEVVTCRMHDLVHDLAKSIARDDLYITKHGEAIPTNVLHKACRRYLCLIDYKQKVHLSIMKKARALHIYKGNFIIDDGISETRCLFRKRKNLKCLRTVVLDPTGSIPFPLSVMKLIMLRYLQISKLKCQKLPEAICSLWNLQFLHVKDCEQLTALPNDVGKLCNLRTLDLSRCGSIETLPDTMGSCRNLRSLILRGCRTIVRIPISVSQLENLRVLNLSSCNMLENFAEHFFENFKELHNLNLYYCSNIMELPSSIGNLQKLRTLNLSECSRIQQLPASLGTLHSIETINLSACKITSLPDSIGNLENLRVLNLSFCRALTSLPTSISKLHRLCSLLLCGTRLSSLPPQISELVNLECLDIQQCNHFKQLPEGLGKMSNLRYLKNKGCWSLRSTSRGIGALTQLQELDVFAVGRYVSVSELENLDLLSNELRIRHLQELKSLPEAEKAQLEKKQNLYELYLEWTGKDNPDMSLKKLDCLRPNKNIKSFILSGYPAETYPKWMMGIEKNTSPFPYLTYLELRKVKCNSLPQVEFPHLKSLYLCFMGGLFSIKGQQFPSLNSLVLQSMPKLSDLWPTIADEDQKSSHPKPVCTWPIVHLSIWQCPNLKVHPFIPPSVERLELESSNEALLSGVRTNLSEPSSSSSMILPYSTKKLSIYDITASSEWILLHHLSLLTELTIQNCSKLKQLPQSLKGLTDLRELKVDNCENLTELPEWLGELRSLKTLTIGKCPGLKSLPSSISTLTALQAIVLDDCPVLAERCKQEVGEDWHLVSRVPIIFIY